MSSRRDLPRLMGLQEIRDRTGWSRQWTSSVTGSKGFPDPAYTLAAGRFWLAEDVEAWITENRASLAGRPGDEPA